jgi:hypothetical protein
MNEVDQIKSWVVLVGFFNHSAILLKIDKKNDKPPSPYKFNPLCLVANEWTIFDPISNKSNYYQLISTLKRVEKVTIKWVSKKRKEMYKELKIVEKDLMVLFEGNVYVIFNEERLRLKELESKTKKNFGLKGRGMRKEN